MKTIQPSYNYAPNHYGGGYYGEVPTFSNDYEGYNGEYGSEYSKEYYRRSLDLGIGIDLVDELLGLEEQNDSNVIAENIIVPVKGRKDLIIDFTKDTMQAIRLKQPYTYNPILKFKVQNDVKWLRYLQTATRAGIKIEKLDILLGNFTASTESYEVKLPSEEAPDGVEWLGDFSIESKVVDEDSNVYLKFNWDLIIDTHW